MGRSLRNLTFVACLGLLAAPAWAQGPLPGTAISGTATPFGKVLSSGSTIISGVRGDTLFVPLAAGSQRELLVGQIAPPGGYAVIAAHFLSTMLCDCTGGLRTDSTGAVTIPAGYTHLGLRGNIRVGGMGFGAASTQDSAYAGVFRLRLLVASSGAADTLSAAVWVKSSGDSVGSLTIPTLAGTTRQLRTDTYPPEAWDSPSKVLVYNNGTDKAVGGSSPGIQINRPAIFEITDNPARIYAGAFALGITHLVSYVDLDPPAAAAAGSGFPFSFDFDLVAWR